MSAVNIRLLDTTAADFERAFQRVLHWSAETDDAIEQRVATILADVRARGDAAVLEYTERFDGVAAASTIALRSPFGVGTVMTISPTPATLAGSAFISTLEG
jgi:histidinol dehydrogenase